MRSILYGTLVIAAALTLPGEARAERMLRADLTIDAPVSEVWAAWTTEKGIATFFAPVAHVDLRVDGTYDIWFNPSGKPGERGAENMRILTVEPEKRFAFAWNGPPSIPTINRQRTMVILDFEPAGERTTKLRFTELGWGEGPDWDEAFDFLDHSWNAVVLPNLVHRFKNGPIDWKAQPKLAPFAKTLQVRTSREAG